MTQLPIDTPLPLAVPGESAPAFRPEIMDLMARKLNSLWNLQGVGRVKVTRSDGAVRIELLPS